MDEVQEIIFKPTFFSDEQKLVLNPEFIEFYKSPEDVNPIRFSKLEIDGFRFGVKWLRGYQLVFGRVYCVDIKSTTGTIIKIRLTSVYKIRVKNLHKTYNLIVNAMLQYYASELVNQYLKLFNYKQPFSILNVYFSQLGIVLNDKYNIEWNNIDVRTYTRYVAISTKNKSEIYKAFDYIEEWNTLVLYNVLRLILKSKNLLKN
jgi:hypothetical protein